MQEDRTTRVIEIRTGEGKLLGSLTIREERGEPEEEKETKSSSLPHKGESERKEERESGQKPKVTFGPKESPMTDAQKRYMFRILAERGVEGDLAHDELKKAFGVDSLKEVTKFEASQQIERLLAAREGGMGL